MRLMVLCGVLFTMAAGASEPVSPAPSETRRTFLGMALVPAAQGLVALDIEREMSPKLSSWVEVQMGGRLLGNESEPWPTGNWKWLVGLQPGFHYYLTGTVLDGLWVGPRFELEAQWIDHASHLDKNWTAGAAVLVGYSIVVSGGLTVQAGVGLGGSYSSSERTIPVLSGPDGFDESTIVLQSWGIADRVMLAIGWTF